MVSPDFLPGAVRRRMPNFVDAAQAIIDDLAARNTGCAPLGSVGAVVGATIGTLPVRLDAMNGPFLVPGIGAQGGTPDDVRRIFGAALAGVLPSVSREVLAYGPRIAALQSAVYAQAEQFAFLRS